MTLQFTHHPTTTARSARAPRRFERWLLPAGIAVTAVLTFAAVDAVRDDGAVTAPRQAAAPAEATATDFTRSQRLVEQAIDDARSAATATDYTRSQRLIDQAIDEARISTDYTRSQRLIDQAIDDARISSDYTRSQRLIDQAIEDALAGR